MAVKNKDKAGQPTVTRISAHDGTKTAKVQSRPATRPASVQKKSNRFNPLQFAIGILKGILGYFKGAWFELKQVRWPNRRATWSMTGALLGFTVFFVAFILLIDALFQYLFKLVLG